MIISTSRRTDIPAFYSTWLANRFAQGFVLVRNPMNPYQVSRISLTPETVDFIVFWTKNPKPLLPYLSAFERYPFYFQFTLNGYHTDLEPRVPPIKERLSTFKELSKKYGAQKILWRYDPVLLTDNYSIEWHTDQFSQIANELAQFTQRCTLSFLDVYKKCERNMAGVKQILLTNETMLSLAEKFSSIAKKNEIALYSCAETIDFSNQGVVPGKCIDDALIQDILGQPFCLKKDKNQRVECGCVSSVDIGSYNSCPHGCLYCYANENSRAVSTNFLGHNPDSPLLFGNVGERDVIKERK